MIKRPTWIMVIVLAALAGLAYYMQTVPDNLIKKALDAGKTPTPETSTVTLISSTDGLVNGIEITAADGHNIAVKHPASGWTLSLDGEAPIPADQGIVEQASSQALGLQLKPLEIKQDTTDFSGFGLNKPDFVCKVSVESGKIFTFKIGHATITGDGYYLQKEDGTIAVVDKYTVDALLTLIKQPPTMFTATPSPAPVTETPTRTLTPIPATMATGTATPGS
jgi:hypothetical protein